MKKAFLILMFAVLLTYSCKEFAKTFEVKIHNTEAVIEIKLNSGDPDIKNKLRDILNYRFDKYLIYAKFELAGNEPYKLMIRVKNYKNLTDLKSLLEHQGKFEITLLNDDESEKEAFIMDKNQPFVKKASVVRNSFSQPCLNIELKENYKQTFSDFTEKNVGKKTVFKLDDAIIFKPVIREKIEDGSIQLSFPDEASAGKLFLYKVLLLSGQLPFRLNSDNLIIKELKSNSSVNN